MKVVCRLTIWLGVPQSPQYFMTWVFLHFSHGRYSCTTIGLATFNASTATLNPIRVTAAQSRPILRWYV